jgi:hypothetical protein
MCYRIASQLISHDFSGFTAMVPQQTLKEALSRCAISLGLKININHIPILVHGPP